MEEQEYNRPKYVASDELLARLPQVEDVDDLKGVMTALLSEIIHWTWKDMMTLKYDERTLGIHAAVMSIIELCANGKMSALKMVFDRLEGKVETPINIIKPKMYLRYPMAQNGEQLQQYLLENPQTAKSQRRTTTSSGKKKKLNIAELGLGKVLKVMMTMPVDVPSQILKHKMLTDQSMLRGEPVGDSPYVKSVLAASILHNANFNNNYEALQTLLERVEGKIEENIRIIGEDTFIDQYSVEAPEGSILIDGHWCLEVPVVADQWANGYMMAKKIKDIQDGKNI